VDAKKQRMKVNVNLEAELDRLVEEMAETWKWKKEDVFNHVVRSFFKRHKGVPPPPKPPE
jgi:hypothetical protein